MLQLCHHQGGDDPPPQKTHGRSRLQQSKRRDVPGPWMQPTGSRQRAKHIVQSPMILRSAPRWDELRGYSLPAPPTDPETLCILNLHIHLRSNSCISSLNTFAPWPYLRSKTTEHGGKRARSTRSGRPPTRTRTMTALATSPESFPSWTTSRILGSTLSGCARHTSHPRSIWDTTLPTTTASRMSMARSRTSRS